MNWLRGRTKPSRGLTIASSAVIAMVGLALLPAPAGAEGTSARGPSGVTGVELSCGGEWEPPCPPPPPPPLPPPPPPPAHHSGSGSEGSNDPNPNTNPNANTSTAVCSGSCTVTVQLADAQADINAAQGGGSFTAASIGAGNAPVLFGTRNGGGAKPHCPGYEATFIDWVLFGFRVPADGADFRKIGVFTLKNVMPRPEARAAAAQQQVCFEAPYRFRTRAGFELGEQEGEFVGVLPDCVRVSRTHPRRGAASPCVLDRRIVAVDQGWVVRVRFFVPPSAQDPKALG